MRTIGLDVGTHTVGVAVSDPLGWIAQGLETIKIDESAKDYGFERLGEIIKAQDVDTIVIGLPLNMNGTKGPRAEASQLYGRMMEEKWPNLTITYMDERLTTVQAERLMIEKGNVRRNKRKKVIDKMAATLILQNYLDRKSI
ncbi:Holliday junction resolvase RuvX [Allofustis seminis]|uniref:Holliday junction resolvase RuvX n=1 Tax=Allofustis seminis TaxID=166939 RepID=UPI00035E2444|nr:Holliday junction resolvase RuvX [Allofustis seminis]